MRWRVLEPGGRFGFTVEAGRPLTQQERVRMRAAELMTAHQLWSDWLGSGRARKFALVAEKQ